jgi:acyl phosphate:glycerol-3-phosphate acyltransferase
MVGTPPVAWPWLAVAAVGGYLVGSVSPAAVVARMRGVDIRASGSGNPGATNAGRVLGRRFGYLVGVLDVLKGLLPTVVLGALAGPVAAMVAGVAAVLGHCTSPWLRGRGGKGVATSFGAILGVEPWWALVGLVAFLVVVVLTRWVALASVVASAWVVVAALEHWVRDGGRLSAELLVWACALAVIVVVRHRRNFVARLRRDATGRADPRRGLLSWLVVGATLGALAGAAVHRSPSLSWPVVAAVAGAVVAGSVRTVLVHSRDIRV